jgi:hypothetical protein
VKEGGRSKMRSTQEGVLLVLREKALRGDARALDRLLDLAARFNAEVEIGTSQGLDADDQALLAAYAAEVAGTVTRDPTNIGSSPTRSERSDKKEQQ